MACSSLIPKYIKHACFPWFLKTSSWLTEICSFQLILLEIRLVASISELKPLRCTTSLRHSKKKDSPAQQPMHTHAHDTSSTWGSWLKSQNATYENTTRCLKLHKTDRASSISSSLPRPKSPSMKAQATSDILRVDESCTLYNDFHRSSATSTGRFLCILRMR